MSGQEGGSEGIPRTEIKDSVNQERQGKERIRTKNEKLGCILLERGGQGAHYPFHIQTSLFAGRYTGVLNRVFEIHGGLGISLEDSFY